MPDDHSEITGPHPHGPAGREADGLWQYSLDLGRCVPVAAIPYDPSDLMRRAQMRDAIERQMAQRRASQTVDRTGWTDQQWIDDARVLMNHPDGAITSLTNGHVLAMLREIDRLDTEFAS